MLKSSTLFAHSTELAPVGVWEQTVVASSASILAPVSAATTTALIAELERPKPPGDTHVHAANRREAALRAQFAQLPPHESLALQRRLEMAAPDDPLAIAFARLVPERRARLLAHLEELRVRRR
jgi:hypothetical protein